MNKVIILFLLLLSACQLPLKSGQTQRSALFYSPAEIKQDLEKKDIISAEMKLEIMLDEYPNDQLYLPLYADLLYMQGKCQELASLAPRIRNSNPSEELKLHENLALCYLQNGRISAAKDLFNNIIEKDAMRWRSVNGLGLCAVIEERYNEARQYFEIASYISTDAGAVLNNLAMTKALQGEYSAASAILERLLKRDNLTAAQRKKLSLNLALIYGLQEKFNQAYQLASNYMSKEELNSYIQLLQQSKDNVKIKKQYVKQAMGVKKNNKKARK